jgi:hypothetical protein
VALGNRHGHHSAPDVSLKRRDVSLFPIVAVEAHELGDAHHRARELRNAVSDVRPRSIDDQPAPFDVLLPVFVPDELDVFRVEIGR